MTRWVTVIPALILTACSQGAGRGADGPEGGAGVGGGHAQDASDASECSPERVGLAAARRVPVWRAPEGCTESQGGDATVHSEEELRSRYACPAGVTLGVDFGREQLVIVSRTLSPAGAGTDIYDDGAKVTFVNRQRTNCPNDPMPMPMQYTLAFVLPSGAERTYAEAACTIRRACD